MTGNNAVLPGTRALVIDDNAFSRRLLRTMLCQIGITEIIEASDGMTGLQAARVSTPDLIILDWIMPQMSGAETLHRLARQTRPSLPCPVLVTSTIACREAIVSAARFGAAGVIVKPFATPTLRARIERIMAEQVSQRATPSHRRRA